MNPERDIIRKILISTFSHYLPSLLRYGMYWMKSREEARIAYGSAELSRATVWCEGITSLARAAMKRRASERGGDEDGGEQHCRTDEKMGMRQ